MSDDQHFTLAPFEGRLSWSAERFGEPWNGFVTPTVTREVLKDLLISIGDGHRWDAADAVVWPTIDLSPDDQPEYEDRIEPGADGLYDLGPLGWTFERC